MSSTPATSSSIPAAFEALEPRLLLDANWAGQWFFTGYDVTSDESTREMLEMEPWSTTFQITEQAGGGYNLVAAGRGPLRHTLTERADILGHDYDGGDLDGGNSYVQDGTRILPITDEVALFVYAQGKYASSDMWDFWDATASIGLMTRQAIAPTQMPWEGDYALTEIVAECETQYSDAPGLNFHYNELDVTVTDAGGGTYEARQTGQEGEPEKVMTESGNALIEHDIEETDNYREEKSFTFRGPDGMLYHLGAYTSSNREKSEIWLTEHYAAVLQSQGYQAPAPDLTGEVQTAHLPTSSLAGDRLLVPVTVTNGGNEIAIARGSIDLYLSTDGELDEGDALVASADNLPLVFRPGQSRTYRFWANLPDSQAHGEYRILADIDSGNDLPESNEPNHLAFGPDWVAIDEAQRDLTAEIGTGRVPASVVSGDRSLLVLPVTLTNEGNVPIERGQWIDVGYYARPVGAAGEADDVLIDTQSIPHASGLRPGQARQVRAVLTLPAGLADGEYEIVTKIDTGDDVEESDETNNQAVSEQTVEVALGYVDLTASLHPRSRIPASVVSGDNTPIIVLVGVTNEGNIRVPRGETVDIGIYARPEDGGDDILLDTIEDRPVTFLAPQRTLWSAARVTLPAELEGNYRIVTVIDADGALESGEDGGNNQAVSEQVIEAAEGYVDLTVDIHDRARIPASVVSGDNSRLVLPVLISNEGNVPVERGQWMDVGFYARPVGAEGEGDDIELRTLALPHASGLRPGQTRGAAAVLTLPAGLGDGEYDIITRVDVADDIDEKDETNNQAVADQRVEVAMGYVDLTATIHERSRIPASIVSGQPTPIILLVGVTNEGNIRAGRGETVGIHVYARPEGGGEDILVHTIENRPVTYLAPQRTIWSVARVTLPAELEGDYRLVAEVAAEGDLEAGEDAGNNQAVSEQVIEVAEGYVDLIADVPGRFALPQTLVEGDPMPQLLVAELTNAGNIRLPLGQRVDVGLALRPVNDAGEPTGDDIAIDTIDGAVVSFLAPGRSRLAVSRFVLPSGVEPGTYEWVVTADVGDDLDEKFEDNNETAAPMEVGEYEFPWAGTWLYTGTAIEAEPYQEPDIEGERSVVRIESAGEGQFHLHPPDSEEPVLLTPDGDALVAETSYEDDGEDVQTRIILQPIGRQSVLVNYAEGAYDGQGLNWSFGTLGIARRGGFAPNRQPLDGTYDAEVWSTWIDRVYPEDIEVEHDIETMEFRMRGANIEVWDGDTDSWQTFVRRGRRWELEQQGWDDEGEYRSGGIHLYPGPGDTYYAVGFDAWFEDASMETLYGFDYFSAIITPQV